jgi:hypothetical protein
MLCVEVAPPCLIAPLGPVPKSTLWERLTRDQAK